MEDPELAALRAKRLAEMRAQSSSRGDDAGEEEQRRRQQEHEQVRQGLLSRILSSDARQRLSRIAMVKPERALALENFIITSARNGQLRGSSPSGQLTEADLVSILERVMENEPNPSPKITFQRRADFLDSDDDM